MKRIFHRGMIAALSIAWLAIGVSLTWAQVPIETVALSGTPAPGASANFASFATPQALNHNGQAAFIGFIVGNNGWSQWRGSSNTDLTLVSRAWDTAPGTGGRTFLNYSFAEMNDNGQLAFTAQLTEYGSTTPVASTSDIGMWVGESPATLTFVMRKGDIAPGTGGKIFGNPGPPALNNNGQVAFKAFLLNPDNTSAGPGIWTGSSNADLTLIARRGDVAPTGGVFFDFSHPDFNNSGEMAFHAHMTTYLAV